MSFLAIIKCFPELDRFVESCPLGRKVRAPLREEGGMVGDLHGHTGPCLARGIALTVLKFLVFKQGAPNSHFALGAENYAAHMALSPGS